MENFRKLGISNEVLRVIEESKFDTPSEIQVKTIPLVLQGKDVIGGSATGSGKTLAFGAGIIDKLERGKGIQSLILTPTRELAEQDARSLHRFSKFKGLSVCAIYGGVSMEPQIRDMQRADIVVGTPGRVLDHLKRRNLRLEKVKILVLDEADRMLDMGFIDDVVEIINHCPKERQTLLFSATISPDITRIAKRYMKDPVNVEVESYVDATKLEQAYYDVPKEKKFSLLVHLLKQEHAGLVMVFCNTRMNADFVANNLGRYGIDAVAIHGGLNQNKRSKIMENFHDKRVYALICTDVAARGLDIKGVSHVYNYDVPKTSKEYIHRIGRTARAGKEGKAVSLVSPFDYENFRKVLEDKEIIIKNEPMPEVEQIFVKFNSGRESRGYGGGSRGGRGGGRSFGGGGGRRFGGGGGGRGYGGGSRGGSRDRRGGESRSSGESSSGGRRQDSSGGRGDRSRFEGRRRYGGGRRQSR